MACLETKAIDRTGQIRELSLSTPNCQKEKVHMREVSCAVVGEPGCGKSSLVSKFCLDEYPASTPTGESLPTINSAAEDPDTGEIVSLAIRDTR